MQQYAKLFQNQNHYRWHPHLQLNITCEVCKAVTRTFFPYRFLERMFIFTVYVSIYTDTPLFIYQIHMRSNSAQNINLICICLFISRTNLEDERVLSLIFQYQWLSCKIAATQDAKSTVPRLTSE